MHDVTPRPEDATTPEAVMATRRERWTAWLPLILGLVLALALLEYARTHILIRLSDAAFGAETKGFTDDPNLHTQCADGSDSQKCVDSFRHAGSPERTVLWFGNSQLAGINRYKPGDVNAPELVRRTLQQRGAYLVSYSQPNANLSEEAILFNALAPIYRPKLLILPVCYDDIRELGIRDTVDIVRARPEVQAVLATKSYWAPVAAGLKAPAKPSEPGKIDTDATVQARVESKLTQELSDHWKLWSVRQQLRGTMGFAIHGLRNKAMGIHSTSKRPVDPHVYAERLALLEGMVADARSQGIAVLLYAPPYRQDIDGPYIWPDYLKFKADLKAIADRHGARFADIDPIVPGPEWATVTDDLFGFKEPDFMHFTAAGHKRFAAAIDAQIRAMGF